MFLGRPGYPGPVVPPLSTSTSPVRGVHPDRAEGRPEEESGKDGGTQEMGSLDVVRGGSPRVSCDWSDAVRV